MLKHLAIVSDQVTLVDAQAADATPQVAIFVA